MSEDRRTQIELRRKEIGRTINKLEQEKEYIDRTLRPLYAEDEQLWEELSRQIRESVQGLPLKEQP
jgi:hypothetical protein